MQLALHSTNAIKAINYVKIDLDYRKLWEKLKVSLNITSCNHSIDEKTWPCCQGSAQI